MHYRSWLIIMKMMDGMFRESVCFVLTLFSDHFRSLPLLLPAVEDGIFSDSWRIRQSSVELLGDLLFKVHATHPCQGYLQGIYLSYYLRWPISFR